MFVVAPEPIYQHYADLPSRPGGISALTDQQLAGGMMWVGGSIAYTIALLIALYKWVAAEQPPRAPVRDTVAHPGPPGGSPSPRNGSPVPVRPEVLQTR